MRISFNVIWAFVFMSLLPFDAECSNPPKGVMAFGWGSNFKDTTVFELPYIDGMTAYFSWKDLQPGKSEYDFTVINKLKTVAERNGKILNIGIYPGSHTPEWVYSEIEKTFTWGRVLKEDQARFRGRTQIQTSPYPWDKRYLKYWKKFIEKIIHEYANSPSVGYISLTGPTIRDLSTGILLKEDADWERFSDGIDVKKSLFEAWVEVIGHYNKINGTQRYVIALGPLRPKSSDIWLAHELAKYISNNDIDNVSLMSVFLNDTWFTTGGGALKIRGLLKNTDENVKFGYQMAQSVARNETWVANNKIVKSLDKALTIGYDDGASWIEVWHDDIIVKKTKKPNTKYQSAIQKLHSRLWDL